MLAVVCTTFVTLHTLRADAFADTRPLLAELGDYLRRMVFELDLGRSARPRNPEVVELIGQSLPADVAPVTGGLAVRPTRCSSSRSSASQARCARRSPPPRAATSSCSRGS